MCEETGLCGEPEVCVDDEDCLAERLCAAGTCREPCLDDAVCDGAQRCDEATGRCVEPLLCTLDDDCLGLRVCEHSVCLFPGCQTHADCPGACVDRGCGQPPPAACGPDRPCPGSQVCLARGACALDGPCEADADCPAGLPRCAAGRCAGCGDDGDCAAAEYCWEGACRYLGACEADADCPGDRTCGLRGSCVASAGCAGDRLDRAAGVPQVFRRTYTGLVLCDGEGDDRYRLSVPAGEGVRVTLSTEPGPARPALTVREVAGAELGRSDWGHGVEVVELAAAEVERELDLVVRGRPGWSPVYDLAIEALGPADCPADGLEGLLGNDDAAHAAPVRPGVHALLLCPGDEDWLALDLPAGAELTARLSTTAAAGGLVLELLGVAGEPIAVGTPEGEALLAVAPAPDGGRTLVRVRPEAPGGALDAVLTLEVGPAEDAVARACAAAPLLALSELLEAPPRVPVDRVPVSCAELRDGDLVARFHLETPATVRLAATGAAALAVRQDCEDAASEVACTFDLMALATELTGLALSAGDWWVVAKSAGGLPVGLRLTAQGACDGDGDCPDGQVCTQGACRPACADDEACPGRQACREGRCEEPETCLADEDCVGARACGPDGACFAPECETHPDCGGGACVDRVCAAGPPAE